MATIKVNLAKKSDDSYKILIKQGCSNDLPKFLKREKLGNKYAIITDNKVLKLYGKAYKRYLERQGIECEIFSFPDGEKSKHLKTVQRLSQEMIEKKFDRKDAIIALGGGVVGDIAGFLSAIYMRGIPFIQVPTTLLAMVDSSVGGKTGVDLEDCGKNLLGTFTQPKGVFIDIKYLKTLSPKQLRSGLAEVIKYGVIRDRKLFKFIEQNLEKILALEEKSLNKIIKRSVEIKGEVVEEDEKEQGIRMILNYGHTYGHAIEKLSNYKLLHGYAISIGMVIANKLAVEQSLLAAEEAERIKKLLKRAGLPTTTIKKPQFQDLMSDKKKDGNQISFILATKIGEVVIKKIQCPSK